MKECSNCGHPAAPGDAFCSYCGNAVTVVTASSWLDFFLNPRQFFKQPSPPGWAVAVILVLAITLLSGVLNIALQIGWQKNMIPLLWRIGIDLPPQVMEAMQGGNTGWVGQVFGWILGLVMGMPIALIFYFGAAGIYYGIGYWQGGRGSWAAFTRWYALLELPQILVMIGSLPMVVVLVVANDPPPILLMLVGIITTLAGIIVWGWKLFLRYGLLAGALQLSDLRAAGIVIGFEIAKFALVTLMVLGLFLIGFLIALLAGGAAVGLSV